VQVPVAVHFGTTHLVWLGAHSLDSTHVKQPPFPSQYIVVDAPHVEPMGLGIVPQQLCVQVATSHSAVGAGQDTLLVHDDVVHGFIASTPVSWVTPVS